MKFVDEAKITVNAGNGGHGCLSFRREKYIEFGGPNGGDGGKGGNVYLCADAGHNTLVDFHYKQKFIAENGRPGMGSECTGRGGADLTLQVPVGTMVFDELTGELIADLKHDRDSCVVAYGGDGGLGNARFKSSVNRAPRKVTSGFPGERRSLRLELQLLADVGLAGLPNAGKSQLIRSVSRAQAKVAEYPFTTLTPNLGVVNIPPADSFVMADIPGLIAGASLGAGLGIKFLKHLKRTRLLLHIVDISSQDQAQIIANIQQIMHELTSFSPELAAKPIWLVFNKNDLLPDEEGQKLCEEIVQALAWDKPWYRISGATAMGTEVLCKNVMQYLSAAASV